MGGHNSCVNCQYGTRKCHVIYCDVRGIMKSKPFTACGNYEQRKEVD